MKITCTIKKDYPGAGMRSYMNEFTHEYWTGNEDRTKAPDYVYSSQSSIDAQLIYIGRIGGVATGNQTALKALKNAIINEVLK